MKYDILNKIRIPASFILLYNAILNAVFADNRYFIIFAISAAFFSALLLVCCIVLDENRGYKVLFSVFYTAAAAAAVIGIFGNIVFYRVGALLFIIISVSELIRMQKRAGKSLFTHIAAAVFAYVPLLLSLCFIVCDIKPEIFGNGTVYVEDNGGYGTVSKRTYTTARGYSVIYYPGTDTEKEFPVIAYLHGFYIFNNSDTYEDTYFYLSSCGYIVIAPNYESMFLNPANYTDCAVTQIKDGIAFAEKTLKAKPMKQDGEYLIGLAGHSVGAVTALNISAENKLPVKFSAAFDASDGGADIIPKDDLRAVNEDVNILIAAGADDTENCFRTSAFYIDCLSDHPDGNKAFYTLYSDENGEECVVADHKWMKNNASTNDNLRKYGAYKWCRAIADWSFYGKNYDGWHEADALYMGEWSDGTELKRAAPGLVH